MYRPSSAISSEGIMCHQGLELPSFPARHFPRLQCTHHIQPSFTKKKKKKRALPSPCPVHMAGMFFVYGAPLSQQWTNNSHLGSADFFREAFPGCPTKRSHLLLAQDPTPDFEKHSKDHLEFQVRASLGQASPWPAASAATLQVRDSFCSPFRDDEAEVSNS